MLNSFFKVSLKFAIVSSAFCCLMCNRFIVFWINYFSHFLFSFNSWSLVMIFFGIDIPRPSGAMSLSLHLDRNICCCFQVDFLHNSSKILLKIGVACSLLSLQLVSLNHVDLVGIDFICVMIINEIVNRIVFQQHIYITRYFAVLLTASTGVASLGPLLSLDGFHRQ